MSQEKYDELAALVESAVRLQDAAHKTQEDLNAAVNKLSRITTSVADSAQENLNNAVKNSISGAANGFTKALKDANVQAGVAAGEYRKAGKWLTFKLFAWVSLAYVVGIASLLIAAWFFIVPQAHKAEHWERKARYYYEEVMKICSSPGPATSAECQPYLKK